MRSLLSPGPVAEVVAPPVTAPASTAATAPESPRPPGAGRQLQSTLYSTTERLAIALVERAERDLTTAADGHGPSVRELQQAVEFAMGLLVKLPKLKPEDEDEDAGVDILREAMTDPAKVVARLHVNPKFIAALRAKGWLPPPDKPHHRPTKEQVAQRAEYAARLAAPDDEGSSDDDDSELQAMLGGRPQ